MSGATCDVDGCSCTRREEQALSRGSGWNVRSLGGYAAAVREMVRLTDFAGRQDAVFFKV
jgi:hypothetical protein